jgi:outer membrane protein assembly factor BamA
MHFYKKIYLLSFFLLANMIGWSQSVKINAIVVNGNKKTKEKTILRELHCVVGDSIPTEKIGEIVEKSRLQLMNTNLFSEVKVNVKNWDYDKNTVQVNVDVVENWYIYPYAFADLADRNFNVWWNEKNHDLKRVNYYVGLRLNNLSGHRDILKTYFQFGFGRKVEVNYTLPNIGKKNRFGLLASVLYSKNKEVWYDTKNDKLQYYVNENDNNTQQNTIAYSGISFRPEKKSIHYLKLQYDKHLVSDSVAFVKNPYYFLQKNKLLYWTLEYKYSYDNRDFRIYPTKGNFISLTAEKQGLRKEDGVDAIYGTLLYAKYFKISPKVNFEGIGKIRHEFSGKRQPYLNLRNIGFGKDYLRGYEYNVIDGTDFAYLKTSFRYLFFKEKLDFGEMIPEKSRYFPIKVYFTLNNDFGIVKNQYQDLSNHLQNRALWGKGLGVDLIIYDSFIAQIELSFNHLSKGGLFLHFKKTLE